VHEIAVNPPPSALGRVNAILAGRARHYDERFAGPLSIKSVVRGSGVWTTGGARFEVTPHTALLLNDGEEYAIEIDAREPIRFASTTLTGAKTPMHRTTIVGSRPATEWEMSSPCWIDGSSGPTATICGRRLSDAANSPASRR